MPDHALTRLLIHIGTHKTGTSSFQKYMVDTADRYRADGINFLLGEKEPGVSTANRFTIGNAVLRRSLMTGTRMRKMLVAPSRAERIAVFDALGRQVAAEKAPCQVLSTETFCFARTETEQRWVKMLLARVEATPEIFVTFRKQKDWRKSWASQLRKLDRRRAAGRPTLAFGDGFSDIRNEWYFNREAICNFWRQFGTLHIVDYDEALAQHGSIIPALTDAMGLPLLENHRDYWKNSRD